MRPSCGYGRCGPADLTGEGLMRQRIRRLHPDWTPAQVESSVARWLHERPGAEDGDAAGRPVSFATRER